MNVREIKFRVWNTAAKAMYPVEHFALRLDGKELQWIDGPENDPNFRLNSSGCMIYMQFTGLKDKNGREIYEGDILRGYGEVCFGKVGYDGSWNGLTGFYYNSGYYTGFMEFDYHFDPENIEVIGNKWQHPELLSGKESA